MVSIADWVIVLASLITACATVSLAWVARGTLDAQRRVQEMTARIALLDHRLSMIETVRDLVERAQEHPGMEEGIAERLEQMKARVLYLFGKEDAAALEGVRRAVLNLVPFRKRQDLGGGSSETYN